MKLPHYQAKSLVCPITELQSDPSSGCYGQRLEVTDPT